MSDGFLSDALDAARNMMSALGPAAIGSAVAQAYQRGLSLRDRLVQWLVGISVSYYVTAAAADWFSFGAFVAQGVGFVIAMIAFQATPKFIAGAGDALGHFPRAVSDWFLRRKGDE